jgi:hypothetical protein
MIIRLCLEFFFFKSEKRKGTDQWFPGLGTREGWESGCATGGQREESLAMWK